MLAAVALACTVAHGEPRASVHSVAAPPLLLSRPLALEPASPHAGAQDDDARIATARLRYVGHKLDDQLDAVVTGASALAYRIIGRRISGFVQTLERPRLFMIGVTFITSRL